MGKYYALYDIQLGGYKAGLASENHEEVLKSGAERAYYLSQSDEEPASENLTDQELLDNYDYEVKEVTERHYKTILNSQEYGLLTVVTL